MLTTLNSIKNALRKSFADKANDFAMALNTMQLAISGLEGDVEDQLHHVRKLSDNLPPLDAYLIKIEEVDAKCQEANIEENDFTPIRMTSCATSYPWLKVQCPRS